VSVHLLLFLRYLAAYCTVNNRLSFPISKCQH